ncbi:hypothetical protein I0C86_41295 [Plantactinospora sp. S1510]|uniref:Uncharacterized protein n=1 Tax=Plantactinospora alkalitolerans TaxID=2789879 RepID=A0ABS0H9X9_9ACTN|nr:hypothetical protein [Plantactinospora alkalitolerans]MBF9135289.1 hypothetical protein [Plantactinospora alkalitolerans]
MQYVLRHPMIITASLVPGIRVSDGEIRVEAVGQEPNGRTHFRYVIETPNGRYESPKTGREVVNGREVPSLTVAPLAGETLGDLAARAASLLCEELASEESDLGWLPRSVQEWARDNMCDLYVAYEELEALRD